VPPPAIPEPQHSGSRTILTAAFLFIFVTLAGVIVYGVYNKESPLGQLVSTVTSLAGFTNIQNEAQIETPSVTQQPPSSSSLSVTAVVTQQPTTTEAAPTIQQPKQTIIINPSLDPETRKKDLATLQGIQAKCLSRYGNVQFCFDGNSFVAKKIIESYETISTKSFAEKNKFLESASNKAISGSDTVTVTTINNETYVNGRPILLSLNTNTNPATCSDKKTTGSIELIHTLEEIKLCTPKPEVLTNITCSTFATTIALCSKGMSTYGQYNSNDDPDVQALLKKYTDALFAEPIISEQIPQEQILQPTQETAP
jgi:hypothetical protein